MKRTMTLTALTLASALTLTACGTGAQDENAGAEASATATGSAPAATPAATDTATPSATESATSSATGSAEEVSAEHNDADVMFAQMMIPHHQQAVEMSEMLLAKDDVPAEVAAFAQKVIDAQGPEIERMNAMLTAWGQDPVDTDGMDGMEGMDHGGMSGMMSEEDMTALDQAQGTEAARLYLEQMTAHHKGAVDMAKDEAKDGQNPQAVQLAEQVIADQEAEITEMQQMLDKL
ncbi:DUF305 domain-containing protein [Micrococcus luteus]|mgnify:CR=1 FL=1|uniref:DUF305 domain-containing protein n=1 Tax=Micrococcus TaxID=1269 RepID=UPI000597C2DB|nr:MULTISPECIES: DUF305 domain-containing protein [Micrococcus]CVN95718.1 Uncharacterized protein conserved in bacteria [Streptococcus pneumoniae]KIK89820.1 hypothetical protein OC70_01400 [Micrococcus luteus]MBF0756533.1 DUF305 domain-containing protein [Micrococcus aloeverae]MBS9537577.1 DUF305 domain-containing protein [Micrococcus luteus]MCO0633739.1 DUF305 domain-containing protein [Micrococcus yunnanensis]